MSFRLWLYLSFQTTGEPEDLPQLEPTAMGLFEDMELGLFGKVAMISGLIILSMVGLYLLCKLYIFLREHCKNIAEQEVELSRPGSSILKRLE